MTRARHKRIFSEVTQMLSHRKTEFCHIEIKTRIFFLSLFRSFFFLWISTLCVVLLFDARCGFTPRHVSLCATTILII